jgi:hypothetical protein
MLIYSAPCGPSDKAGALIFGGFSQQRALVRAELIFQAHFFASPIAVQAVRKHPLHQLERLDARQASPVEADARRGRSAR